MLLLNLFKFKLQLKNIVMYVIFMHNNIIISTSLVLFFYFMFFSMYIHTWLTVIKNFFAKTILSGNIFWRQNFEASLYWASEHITGSKLRVWTDDNLTDDNLIYELLSLQIWYSITLFWIREMKWGHRDTPPHRGGNRPAQVVYNRRCYYPSVGCYRLSQSQHCLPADYVSCDPSRVTGRDRPVIRGNLFSRRTNKNYSYCSINFIYPRVGNRKDSAAPAGLKRKHSWFAMCFVHAWVIFHDCGN